MLSNHNLSQDQKEASNLGFNYHINNKFYPLKMLYQSLLELEKIITHEGLKVSLSMKE